MENTFGINIIPDNDSQRVEALKRYKILDTPPENAFDNVARLATQIFKVPISLVSLVDTEKVYFKANVGMGNAKVTSRGLSLCSLAVLDPGVTVFENAKEEPCLLSNPNVAGSFGLEFYAGAPLTTHDGFLIGTLCIIDKTPRPFGVAEQEILQSLAKIVMDEIELRLSAIKEIEKQQGYIEEAAAINEELLTSNEELLQTQINLNLTNEALSASEDKAKYLIANAPVAIGVLTGDDLIVESANDKLLELWGKTADVIHKPLHLALPELQGQPFIKILNDVLVNKTPFYGNELKVMLVRNAVLEEVYFNFVYHPLKDLSGNANSLMIVATDVTEQVLARTMVSGAEERLRLAVDAANLGSWFIDPETKALEYNDKLKNIFGYEGAEKMTYDQAIGQVTEEYRSILNYEITKAIESGDNYDVTYTQRRFNDNKLIWLRSIGKITPDDKGNYTVFSGVVMDVTEQVKNRQVIEELNRQLEVAFEAEVAANEELLATNEELNRMQENLVAAMDSLAESEELKALAIEQAKIGIWYIDAETREFIPSDRLKEFFGYGPDEIMSYESGISQIREDYRDMVVNKIEEALLTGSAYDIEYPIITYRTGQTRWVRTTGKLNVAENASDSYLSGTIMDVTEQKEDDQRKNDFISMVSHELKTPLTSMNGYIQILAMKATKNNDVFGAGLLDKVSRQTKKMTILINGFLNMKRLETGKIHIEKQLFDLAELVLESEEESLATITSHKVIFAPVETTIIEADRDKIGQVINNLISNAVKYSPPGSTINVSCVTVDNTALFGVKDAGMGVNEADKFRLFDRFYRVENKETDNINGFGIGLYLCKEIITRHNGKIWVESEYGKGSTFYFSLPL